MTEVILVNELDEPTGTMEKIEAHKKAMLHRAFSIFIFNNKGEVCFSRNDQNILHAKTFDLSSLPSGIYFIQLIIDGQTQITKVVKE